jgi:shikimate kinase
LNELATAPDRVLLIGMMGAGKSTVALVVAGRLSWDYLDTDQEILRRTGRTVPEIWRENGEAAFRAEEAAVIAHATSSTHPVVVALGGGAVLDPANRARVLDKGLIVWLRVRVETLIRRIGDGAGRPLLEHDPVEALTTLDEARAPIYASLAQLVIDVDDLDPSGVAERIVSELDRRRVARDGRASRLGTHDLGASEQSGIRP